MDSVYERQMLWELSRHRKQQQVALSVDAASNEGCTFEPQLISKQRPRKKGASVQQKHAVGVRRSINHQNSRAGGSAAENSFADHVSRYQRGRKERKEFEARTETARLIPGSEVVAPTPQQPCKLRAPTKSKHTADTSRFHSISSQHHNLEAKVSLEVGVGSLSVEETCQSTPQQQLPGGLMKPPTIKPPKPPNMQTESNVEDEKIERKGNTRVGNGTTGHSRPNGGPQQVQKLPQSPSSSPPPKLNAYYATDEESCDQDIEETFFEQLQRERREWQRERARMQKVIELQQNEIGKRGDAVETRAMDIAASFTSAVGSFEQRLTTFETSMQNMMRNMRSEIKILTDKADAYESLEAEITSLKSRP